MKYFTECRTEEEVKKEFTRLAKELHPDNGGDAEEFKKMMADYMKAAERCKGKHTTADGKEYEKATATTPEEFAEIINKIIHLDGVKIEIIGAWVWVSGNTYEYRDLFKSLRFFFCKSKRAWAYNGGEGKTRRGRYSMKELRNRWGSQEVETEAAEKLSA